jgi:hypothetical protein
MIKTAINFLQNLAKILNLRLIVLFIAFFALFSILGGVLVSTYDQKEVQKEKEKNKQPQKEKEKSKSDTAVELGGRKLGLSYPGEELYIANNLTPKNTTPAGSTASPTQQPANEPPKTHSPINQWLSLIFG